MTNYKIKPWFERDNKTFLRRITLPVRKWVMTPEEQISFRSWTMATLPVAIVAALIFAAFFAETLAGILATENAWAGVAGLVFFILGVAWGIINIIKTGARDWINARAAAAGYNDETTANNYTVKIIDKAEEWLLLYDYGEDNQDNIYHSQAVREALLAKLQDQDSKFEVSMIFKKDQQEVDKLPLVKALKQWQREHPESPHRVYFTYQVDRGSDKYKVFNWYCKQQPYHYKINDQGYAYLTVHSEWEVKRKFIYAAPLADESVQHRLNDCVDFHQAAVSNSR